MLRGSSRPSWVLVRKFLLPSQPPKVCSGGGRAHSCPATRSCFPATAGGVLWAPARDASVSGRRLELAVAAPSRGGSPLPLPRRPRPAQPRARPRPRARRGGGARARPSRLPPLVSLGGGERAHARWTADYRSACAVNSLVLTPCVPVSLPSPEATPLSTVSPRSRAYNASYLGHGYEKLFR